MFFLQKRRHTDNSMKLKRNIVVFIVVFVSIGFAVIAFLGKNISSKANTDTIDTKRVETLTVKREKAVQVSELSAVLLGNEENELAFEKSGRIVSMKVKEGDKVSAGELLAQLDDSEHSAEVSSRATQIEKAKVKFRQAKTDFARMKELFRQQAISRSKYEDAENEFSLAEKDYLQAQKDYAYTTDSNLVRSPINGIVLAKMAAIGQVVTNEIPVYRVGQTDKLKILLPVPDREIAFWHVGDTVQVTLYQDIKQGKVVRIFPVTNKGTGTINAEVIVDNSKEDWHPGQVITASRPVKEKNGIFIPAEALLNCGEDKPYLFVVEEGKALKRPVITGDIFNNKVEITEGLREGEQVVIRGADRLFDMDAVQVIGEGQK